MILLRIMHNHVYFCLKPMTKKQSEQLLKTLTFFTAIICHWLKLFMDQALPCVGLNKQEDQHMLRQHDAKLHIIPYRTGFPQQNSGSQDIMIPVSFCMLVATSTIYPVMFRFPLFVALCDHNPPPLQTDGWTDERTDIMLIG